MKFDIEYKSYRLLLGDHPSDVFNYFGVKELHGLSLTESIEHNNTKDSAYIAGLCNISPTDEKPFVFINLSRCINDVSTTALVFHEMMHLSFELFEYSYDTEEEMITYAENETYKTISIMKELNKQ